MTNIREEDIVNDNYQQVYLGLISDRDDNILSPYGEELMLAIMRSRYEIAELLLEYGAEPNWNTDGITTFSSPLCGCSMLRADKRLLPLLLKYGADPNLRDDAGYLPLDMAISEGSIEKVRLLLDAGADPNMGGYIPLDLFNEGGIDILLLLLKRGIDIPEVFVEDELIHIRKLWKQYQRKYTSDYNDIDVVCQ